MGGRGFHMTLPGLCMASACGASIFFALINRILLGNLASGVLAGMMWALLTYGLIAVTMLGGSKLFGMAGAGIMTIKALISVFNVIKHIGVINNSMLVALLGLALAGALLAQMFLWDGDEKFTAIAIAAIAGLLLLLSLFSCFSYIRFLSDKLFLGMLVSAVGSLVVRGAVLTSAAFVFVKGKE